MNVHIHLLRFWKRLLRPLIKPDALMLRNSRDFFTIAVLMLVSTGMASAQQVNLDVRNEKLVEVFKILRKQSDYAFVFPQKLMDKSLPVTLQLKNTELKDALKQIFKGQPLQYEIQDKTIVIKEPPIAPPQSRNKVERTTTNNQQPIRGTVRDTKGTPLAGVTVLVMETGVAVGTNQFGSFEVMASIGNTLQFRHLGHSPFEAVVNSDQLNVAMHYTFNEIAEVGIDIPNTGYQALPKERATGSFSQIDNELLNRTVSTGVMDRIADVVPGLIFNKGVGGAQGLVIRGQTSINQETSKPLIVVDNFPYEGDINNINPNDVENITILKDAAASSIWGARAGNGVIVITTKQGKFNQKPQLNFNSNFTIGAKPDIFYQPKMSTSDFIDNEIRLFDLNIYNPAENNQSLLHYPLTPVVELLIQKRDNPALASEIDDNINSYRQYDVRDDIEKYFYQNLSRQQYSLQLQGGNTQSRYLISAGYDKNRDSEVGNGLGRFTLNANNSYAFIKDKLELQTNIYYTDSRLKNNFEFPVFTDHRGAQASYIYPYARFADDNGNPLSTVGTYRQSFTNEMESKGFLDWQYRPLDEIKNADRNILGKEYRLNSAISYKILPELRIQLRYQYNNSNNQHRDYYSKETYFTRNLINYYSTINDATNAVNRAIPAGGILDNDNRTITSHNFRSQLNYEKIFGQTHEFNALAGYEISDQKTLAQLSRLYGYDDKYSSSQPVNYNTPYSISIYPSTSYQFRIPYVDRIEDLTSRFVSYFGNFSYRYDKRYLLTGSIRFDQSNIFGVNTNQRGVPLYSVGGAWQINEEKFFNSRWIDELKIRTTWGTSGNVNRSLTSLTTINYSSGVDPLTGFQYASIGAAPNPNLRWEKINSLNLGLDFGVLNYRINGSIDWYQKWGYDIFSTIPYASQTGTNQFTGNYSDTEANGIDFNIQSQNFKGIFGWTTDLQFSFTTDKVTKAKLLTTSSGRTLIAGSHGLYTIPHEGKSLYSVYALPYAGLDPTNGDPLGFLNGKMSNDWTAIFEEARNPGNIKFFGSARPKIFGAFRNTINYKGISISTNISYRLGYYFKRGTYSDFDLNWGGWEHGDYSKRWQTTGDEIKTNIPSISDLTTSTDRGGFWWASEARVEKGDNIRLNDITVTYSLNKNQFKMMPFQQIRLYAVATNLGILWKATNSTEDPDYYQSLFTPVRTFSIGLSATL